MPSLTPAPSITFSQLTEQYLTDPTIVGELRPKTLKLFRHRLTKYALPILGHRPIREITRPEVRALLDAIKLNDTSKGVHAVISVVFSYAVDHDLLNGNPASKIKRRYCPPRTRLLTLTEMQWIWNACGQLIKRGRTIERYGRCIRVLMLTCCRRGEIGPLLWTEVEERPDGWAAVIPAARTKAKRRKERDHEVPLVPEAMAQLGKRDKGPLVFGVRYASEWARGKHHLDKLLPGLEPWTPHDFRRGIVTYMRKHLGVNRETLQALLSHSHTDMTDRYEVSGPDLPAQRAALAKWAAVLTGDRIVGASSVRM